MRDVEKSAQAVASVVCFALICLAMALVVVVVCGCGFRGGTHHGDGPTTEPGATRVRLILFGAPPCSNCHRDFPLVQAELDRLLPGGHADLSLLVYVETGTRWTDPTDIGVTAGYASSLGLSRFTALSDGNTSKYRPSYEAFTRYTGIPLEMAALPAAVLVVNGQVVKVYAAGGTTFIPQAIAGDTVARVLAAVRRPWQ